MDTLQEMLSQWGLQTHTGELFRYAEGPCPECGAHLVLRIGQIGQGVEVRHGDGEARTLIPEGTIRREAPAHRYHLGETVMPLIAAWLSEVHACETPA